MADLKVGHTEDGHSFLGGDPSNKSNWKPVGSVEDGHVFRGGDPSSPDNWEPIPDNTPEARPGEAFAQGFGNAASFGYLPQIQAATEPVIQKALDFFGGDNTDQKLKEQGFNVEELPEESYVHRRDRFIRQGQDLASQNPVASTLGNIGGSLTSGIATGGGLNSLLGNAGKTTGMLQRFKQAAGAGGIMGAIRNPGDTEGELNPLQLEDRAWNAGKDALTGAVIQGGLETVKAVGSGVKNAGKNLKTWSQNKTLKAAGYQKRDFEQAFGKKKAAEIGQSIIDNKLVSVGDNIADVAKKSESALKESGNKIGKIYDKADDITSLNGEDVKSLNNDFINESAKRLEGTVRAKEVSQKLDSVLETLTENRNPTFGELRKLRASIDDEINFAKKSSDLPKYQEELLHLRNKVQDLVKDKIGKVNHELKRELIKENKKFSQFSDIAKISQKKMSGEESNAAFGLRERISTGTGAVVGSMIGGPVGTAIGAALGGISTKVARQYGTPFVALTANKVARALENNSGAIGKFSQPLIDAASKPEKFVATINNLMKDPEFKRSIQGLENTNINREPAKGVKK